MKLGGLAVGAGIVVVGSLTGLAHAQGEGELPGAKSVHVSVSPAVGTPTTHFRVSFRARNNAHPPRVYDIETDSPRHTGCDHDSLNFKNATRGDIVRVTAKGHPRWCRAKYRGTVFLQEEKLGDGRETIVGRFSFVVE